MDFEKLKRARTLLKHSHFNVRKIGKTKKTLLAACTIPFEHAPNSNVTEPRPCFQIECFFNEQEARQTYGCHTENFIETFNFCDSKFHGFFKGFVRIKPKRLPCLSIDCRSIDKFVDLKKAEKVIFLFNNIDPFVCKKLGYNVYEAFQLREFYSIKQKRGKQRFLIKTFK